MERLDRYIGFFRRKRLERDLGNIGLEWLVGLVWVERHKRLLRILRHIRSLWH